MSTRTNRRSTRFVRFPELRRCGNCHKWMRPYDPHAISQEPIHEQNRCPDCFRPNSQEEVERMRNTLLHTLAPDGQRTRLSALSCDCLCECIDTDLLEDTDFEDSGNEEEDDTDTLLDLRTERLMTARPGWRTNVILDEGTDHERRCFYESAGHFAVASSHIADIQDESSRVNRYNNITNTELLVLTGEMQPWELEAAHRATGRPYTELQTIFTDTQDMDVPAPPQATQAPEAILLICPACYKPPTRDWMDWVLRGTVSICTICFMTVRPDNLDNDPDWANFRYNAELVRDYCLCRCACRYPLLIPGARSITITVNRPGQQNRIQDGILPDQEDSDEEEEDETERSSTENDITVVEMVPRPQIPELSEIVMPVDAHGQTTYGAYRQTLINNYGQLLRISNLDDFELNSIQCIEWALEDGDEALSWEDWEEAYRYFRFAYDLYGNVTTMQIPGRPTRAEIRGYLDQIEEHFD